MARQYRTNPPPFVWPLAEMIAERIAAKGQYSPGNAYGMCQEFIQELYGLGYKISEIASPDEEERHASIRT